MEATELLGFYSKCGEKPLEDFKQEIAWLDLTLYRSFQLFSGKWTVGIVFCSQGRVLSERAGALGGAECTALSLTWPRGTVLWRWREWCVPSTGSLPGAAVGARCGDKGDTGLVGSSWHSLWHRGVPYPTGLAQFIFELCFLLLPSRMHGNRWTGAEYNWVLHGVTEQIIRISLDDKVRPCLKDRKINYQRKFMCMEMFEKL